MSMRVGKKKKRGRLCNYILVKKIKSSRRIYWKLLKTKRIPELIKKPFPKSCP